MPPAHPNPGILSKAKARQAARTLSKRGTDPTNQSLRMNPPTLFRIHHSPTHKPSLNYAFRETPSFLTDIQTATIAARSRDTLWTTIATGVKVSDHGTVRHWCKRRLTVALKEALRERGFNMDGTSLQEDQSGLKGSLSLSVWRAMVTADWATVKKEAGRLVDGLMLSREKKVSALKAPGKQRRQRIDTPTAKPSPRTKRTI